MEICQTCGKPKYHWYHSMNHPATQARAERHEFVAVSTPEVTYRDDTFNKVMDDDLIAWVTDGGSV